MKFKPFYQGKLDVFCAIYAVLNGLRLTHGLATLKAREILNDTLLGLSTNPAAFRAVLNQETDYIPLVDNLLSIVGRKYPLEVIKPFTAVDHASVDTFWTACDSWLNPDGAPTANRAIVVRFCRFDKIGQPAIVRHWTTIDSMTADSLHLYDSSHEAEAIQNLARDSVVTRVAEVDETHRLQLQPDSARFMRLPF